MSDAPRTPTHFVYATLPPESRDPDAKDRWLRLGAGWRNQDGSISCILDVMPMAWFAGYRGRFKIVVQENQDNQQDRSKDRNTRR